ncbi:hypothetical protein [Chenggangzhangella methanolivorans]|uniref:Uncharacterized protein n=1 Tax=Chenggangzhangella methanolivorans TaxID=1437009 RepID=A0A9E6RE89_9HYPH|nr:hypothetical protein [Chenggangzhangella methanolivorans]QZN99570.1 hypothetical protein K6K41_23140 [Chenggangzhangella methanolivorans]
MGEAAENPFEDERLAADEAAVDEAILRAGGERQAVRALLVEIGEREVALVALRSRVSLGFERGRQPARPVR